MSGAPIADVLREAAAQLGQSDKPFFQAVASWLTSEARRADLLAGTDGRRARFYLGETLEDKYLKHAVEVAQTVIVPKAPEEPQEAEG